MHISIRVSLSSASLFGALGFGLRAIKVPGGRFWTRYDELALIAVVLVALGAASGIVEVISSHRRAAMETLRGKLGATMQALFVRLLETFGVERYKDLAVHAFLVRWRWAWAWPPRRRELVRVGGFQLKTTPQSGIRWVRGKGLIGVCWEVNQDVAADLAAEWAEYRALDPGAWEALPREVRYNMSYGEYRATQEFDAIVATPIQTQRGRFAGCVSVDSSSVPEDALWQSAREDMQATAQTIALVAGLS